MSFTSVELSVNAAMPSIRTESKEIFSELPGSTSPHPLTSLTPPTPPKKRGGAGKEETSLTEGQGALERISDGKQTEAEAG